MKFLTAIIDALVGFVQRNPLTVLIVLILALGAPALLKGIAMFVLYFILGLIVLACVVMLMFRWRIRKLRRQMEQQFGPQEGFGQGGFGFPFGSAPKQDASCEGEVKVYTTQDTPQKRVAKDVGDYVDFEEEKKEE